jgi:hypothetical protein
MGDVCDCNDLERFLRSPEGEKVLEGLRNMLEKRTIIGVEFSNEIHAIAMTLHLDNGEAIDLYYPSLEVDGIREEYPDVLEREFHRDHPDRVPSNQPT